ncbi:MAG: hypothetical protein A3H35_06755 [Betaproteobacteria bacterium RIFCSPLOWO2_02_FULL_62_17]|nr:MAG: hypothetical protein A3H35_06755 [Betaproteobacteria bacterium RIFCSPLOWO2_02_FULL_62_17]
MTESKWAAAVMAMLVCTLPAITAQCLAQGFPSRAIRVVVPIGTGGTMDLASRVIGKMLGENVGQPVVIDNRAGAGGIIGTELVARAPADGYTLLLAGTPQLAINPALYAKLPYDPIKDFAYITLAVTGPLFLTVNAALPVHSVKDLIAYARSNPGLPYGSAGNGNVHHLGMELFKMLAGVQMTHIPYKGASPMVPAIISGDIKAMFIALPAVSPFVKTGKLRMLAVSEAKRSPRMPDVPTVAEAGVPGYEITTEMGFVAPAGTPRDVVEKLNREIIKVLRTPEIAQQLVPLAIDPVGSTPEQYAETIGPNIEKYRKLVMISGARVD